MNADLETAMQLLEGTLNDNEKDSEHGADSEIVGIKMLISRLMKAEILQRELNHSQYEAFSRLCASVDSLGERIEILEGRETLH